jgi:hypothetical protein
VGPIQYEQYREDYEAEKVVKVEEQLLKRKHAAVLNEGTPADKVYRKKRIKIIKKSFRD